MKIYAPDYYRDFKCIADKCEHNCCIGWEIDIDDDTYNKYMSVTDEFSKQLRCGISTDGEPHFCLSEGERCAFLNNDNLCDIIINLGEEHLCQICADHPRFRNFFSGREEVGLGLCCEAAASLILRREEKMHLCTEDDEAEYADDDEASFFAEREKVFSILQDRDTPVCKRTHRLCEAYNISIPQLTISQWADKLRKLERLDCEWDECLDHLATYEGNHTADDIVGEQLMVYFVYRHMADGFYEGNIAERLAFAIVSHMLITAISAATGRDITDIARMYSAEIEYSEDNMNSILDILTQDCND